MENVAKPFKTLRALNFAQDSISTPFILGTVGAGAENGDNQGFYEGRLIL